MGRANSASYQTAGKKATAHLVYVMCCLTEWQYLLDRLSQDSGLWIFGLQCAVDVEDAGDVQRCAVHVVADKNPGFEPSCRMMRSQTPG